VVEKNVYAEVKDRDGKIVYVGNYHPSFKEGTLELFKEGYPDSFDRYDLEFINDFLGEWEEGNSDQGCLLAITEGEPVGACLFGKVAGPQGQWETSYIFTRETLRGKGIGRILVGIQEEYLKNKARVSFAINPGILPEDVISFPFWINVEYELWGILPGYFRDDLSGIFLVKRNPYYRIGRGIPKDSGWEAGLADSITGKRVSRKEYQKVLHSLKPVSKEKWGLDLIGRENVTNWSLL